MSAFNNAWALLKNMTTDMYEYPKGSGSFVPYEQLPQGSLEKIEADNDRSRENLQNVTRQPVGAHAPHLPKPQSPNPKPQSPNPNNIMVNSKTGVYDPNDPEGFHPMRRGA